MAAFDSRVVVLAIRIAQLIFAVIILGLSAYVCNWWSSYWHARAPSQTSFLVFCSVWTLLTLTFLVLVPWRFSETRANHMFAILGVEALTAIFWFAGFIALAVFLSDRVCFGHVCSAAKAATVFGAFEWALFAGSTGLAVLNVMRTRGRVSEQNKGDPNLNMAEGV